MKALAVLPLLVWAPPATTTADPDCHEVNVVQYVQGLAEVSSKIVCGGAPQESSVGHEPESRGPNVGLAACHALAISLQESIDEFCGGTQVPQPTVTPELIAAALRRLPIPPSELIVQPPNGRTLVNFATNFYTEREEFTRTVRLLGQRVELRITPARFTWHFDDGESTTTSTPGSSYPKLEVTHDYLEQGDVHPRVDTTYTADFRVNGGGWRPVPGSVTIPGESVAVEVVEASPILVGHQ